MNKKKSIISCAICLFITLSTCLMLSGCGFKLRQNATRGHLQSQTHSLVIYLITNEKFSQFTQQLKKSLQQSNILLASNEESAQLTLHIIQKKLYYPPPKTYYSVQSRIYTFQYYVKYQISKKHNRYKQAPIVLSTVRNIPIQSNQSLNATQQQSVIIQEMQKEIIERIITRLRHYKTSPTQ